MVSPWEKFLSPAVVAAVIAALVTLLTQQKQQMHYYITSERAAWRLRIKEAMQELLSSYGIEQATILALQHVKSELNPYGRMLTNATIETPQHFWNKKKLKRAMLIWITILKMVIFGIALKFTSPLRFVKRNTTWIA